MLVPGAVGYPVKSETGASLAPSFRKIHMATTDGAEVVSAMPP